MSTQSDAMTRVRVSERRYNVSRLVILLLAMAALVFYIGWQANHAIKEVKTDNTNHQTIIEQKIDDSFNAQKRFNCSLAIQLTHSDQSVDDCVKTNRLAENPATTPVNPYQVSEPQTTPVTKPPTPVSQSAQDTSGEPAKAPTAIDNRSNLAKAVDGTIGFVNDVIHLRNPF